MKQTNAGSFYLMRIEVSFELESQHVSKVEQALMNYVDNPDVQTEIMTCDYDNGRLSLQLCFFSADPQYRTELVWLHKVIQSVVVPVPVFMIQVHQE